MSLFSSFKPTHSSYEDYVSKVEKTRYVTCFICGKIYSSDTGLVTVFPNGTMYGSLLGFCEEHGKAFDKIKEERE